MIPSRRDFLRHAGFGLGPIALNWLWHQEATASAVNPLATKRPHHRPTARSVIFLFMVGGPSHLDTFDPKPELRKRAGQPLPESTGRPVSQFTKGDAPLLPSTRRFRRHGASGLVVSDLLPEIATCVDDIAVLRSCFCESTIHAPAMYEWHSGRQLMGFPSLGAWVSYGLGTENENLPAYCVMPQPEGVPEGGAPCWGSAFLPAVHQGTLLRSGPEPILNLRSAAGNGDQRETFDLVARLNRMNEDTNDAEWAARTASYELAFRMQRHAPEAVDLSRETQTTKHRYGLDDERTTDFGTRCLLARRLVERGVRFVQVYSGGGPLITQWDAHTDVNRNHEKMCGHVDRPIAALLKDLKHRGLLDETLVIWGGEFGRTPYSQGGKGRDHNPFGFTMFMAGGGIKGGQAIGTTDEFGLRAVERPISVNDFHATILHVLGLDHEALTYRHFGRDERLTDVAGEVVREALA